MKNQGFSMLPNSVRKVLKIFYYSMEELKVLAKRYKKDLKESKYHNLLRNSR
jgi:truncated hemoglobin YjbI